MRSLAAIALLAVLSAVALPAVAQEPAAQGITTNEMQASSLEPHWLPWLGCWELVADAVDHRVVESTGRRVVCVAPRLDGRGVNLTTQIDSRVIADNTVIADGVERSVPEQDCSGTQKASWSADGRRLFSSVAASCGNESQRSVTGMSMLLEGNRWLEIQSVSLDQGEHRELVVRHYDRLDEAATSELGVATLAPALAAQAASARAAAAAPLDVDDVIEANALFPEEVVEAAIVESGSLFNLDTDALIRLADAGIEDRVIDLMVAVSFPDQFVVDSGPSYGGGGGALYVGYSGYPMSCWGRYYSPFYGPYGPGCGLWWGDYGYYPYYGYYPPYYGGGGYRPSVPPSGSLYGGKVINGRGYTAPKVAVPANSPSSSLSMRERASTDGFAYTVRRAAPKGGIGGHSIFGGGKRVGGVSRTGGYTKPGSAGSGPTGSGSSAVRSSSSSGGTAKPRGGGSGGGGKSSGH
ncbi:MAG: hypothetical protein PVJ49_16065 [Acidobacteriota bacterium]